MPIQFQSGPADPQAAPEALANPHRVRTLTVRPQDSGAASPAIQLVRIMPAGPDLQKVAADADWHTVQTVRVPAPSMPRELLGTTDLSPGDMN